MPVRPAQPASTPNYAASILRWVECATLAVVLAAAVLATPTAHAQAYNVLHSFTGSADGKTPYAGLVRDSSGNLYGTTSAGGASNFGTVFKVDTTGAETVLHSFTGGDGKTPIGSLVLDPSGNLYGTTGAGGSSNSGTVFKVDTTGGETVVYSFKGGADGKTPLGGLVLDSSGNLYGTTSAGGSASSGTVFKVDTTGGETVLYSFTGGTDGKTPTGSLVRDAAGNLYGTTNDGGKAYACFLGYSGCGVVFRVDTTDTETVLYTFTGGGDGGNPYYASLVLDAAGNLYGTTAAGGPSDFGTVFKLDAAGTETVLYSFGQGGLEPFAGLVLDAGGNLYGTTTGGGTGFGTVFKLDTAGKETLLHSFGGPDGATPYAGLVLDASGNLYGTTSAGGAANLGTAFEITAAPTFSLSASVLTPSTVSPGGSSTATVNIAAGSALSGSVTLSCSVQPSPAMAPRCSISPGSITLGSPAVLTVSTTGPTANSLHPGSGFAPLYALWVPLIGVAGVGFRLDKRKKGKCLAAALACVFAGLVISIACGGGTSTSGGGSVGGTPAGTYVINVTGTSLTVHHSTTTTLTVH